MRCCRVSIPAAAVLFVCSNFLFPVFAQGRRGGGMARPRVENPRRGRFPDKGGRRTPIQEFETMAPEQRRKALDRLPPAERQRLQERLQKFNQLPPDQQRSLTNLYNRLHELPPERQEAVRKSISRLSQQAPERQQAIREELRGMAGLTPEQRQERMSGPDFRKTFSKKEQEIVRDMSEVLPPE